MGQLKNFEIAASVFAFIAVIMFALAFTWAVVEMHDLAVAFIAGGLFSSTLGFLFGKLSSPTYWRS